MNYARLNTPSNLYRKPKGRCRAPSGSSSRTTVFEGLALVKKLIEMGEKEQAVQLYRKIKHTEQVQ